MVLIVITAILFGMNQWKGQKKKEIVYQEKEEKNIIEYKANEEIRVRFHETGEIVAMDMNDYLRGVLPAEMSPTYHLEALKAQAIVARTYTYQKMNDHGEGQDADICDNFAHCQAFYPKDKIYQIWEQKGYSREEILEFWDKINEAVVSTQGEIITYQGEMIHAFFHASSPDKTENVNQIWTGVSYPYLLSVESVEDETYENRTSQVEISFTDFKEKVNQDGTILSKITSDSLESISILSYTTSGRVKQIECNQIAISAEKLRTMIGLKSTNFTIERKEEQIIFHVLGYGHGVGMSQVGANTYASRGFNCKEIIEHYYTGVDLTKLE